MLAAHNSPTNSVVTALLYPAARVLIVSLSRLEFALTPRKQTTETISNRRSRRGMCNIPFAPDQNPRNLVKLNQINNLQAARKAKYVLPASLLLWLNAIYRGVAEETGVAEGGGEPAGAAAALGGPGLGIATGTTGFAAAGGAAPRASVRPCSAASAGAAVSGVSTWTRCPPASFSSGTTFGNSATGIPSVACCMNSIQMGS